MQSAKLDSKYHMTKVTMGAGGFGLFMKGIEKATDKSVGIKQIKRTKSASSLKDWKYMKEVNSDNVLNLKDFFQEVDTVYLVTDFCEGGDFNDKLQIRGHRLEDWEAQDYAKQLLNGLRDLHDKNICHRNLTMKNILVHELKTKGDPRSILKIANLETAKRFKLGNWKEAPSLADPEFMSPEMHALPNGGGYGLPTDLWSAGIIFCIMITRGNHPFKVDGKLDMDKLRAGDANLNQSFWSGVKTSIMGSHISESAKDLVKLMLVASPDKRINVTQALQSDWIARNLSKPEINSQGVAVIMF